jgi:hypothetical protein
MIKELQVMRHRSDNAESLQMRMCGTFSSMWVIKNTVAGVLYLSIQQPWYECHHIPNYYFNYYPVLLQI